MFHKYVCPICGEVTYIPSQLKKGEIDERLLTHTAYCEECEDDKDEQVMEDEK